VYNTFRTSSVCRLWHQRYWSTIFCCHVLRQLLLNRCPETRKGMCALRWGNSVTGRALFVIKISLKQVTWNWTVQVVSSDLPYMDEAYGMNRIQSSNYQALSRFNVSILRQELIYKEMTPCLELLCYRMLLSVQNESKVITTFGRGETNVVANNSHKCGNKGQKLVHVP
jgi:hypothetical protein